MSTFAKLSSRIISDQLRFEAFIFFFLSMYLFIYSNEPTNSSQEGNGDFFAMQM